MKLLKTDGYRFLKDKSMWILVGITFFIPLLIVILMNIISTDGVALTNQDLIVQCIGTTFLCPIIGIALSLFIGSDYTNNTIRNKICYGEGKVKIALFYLLETVIISLMFIVVSIVGCLLFGIPFTEYTFTSDFMAKLMCQVLIVIAFSLVITSVVISSKSGKAGIFTTVICSVLMMSMGTMMTKGAATSSAIQVISRCLYSTVSSMMLSATDGAYTVASKMGASFTFENMYLNAVLMSVIYIAISVSTALFVTKKHNYK